MYNDSALLAANTPIEILQAFNELSHGLYFTLVLFLIIFIWKAANKKQEFKDVFLGGTFFGAVISVFLLVLHLVKYQFVVVPCVAFFIALFIYLFTKD